MKYTTVFLDFDDTLIDTESYAIKCLEKLYENYSINEYFPTFNLFKEIYLKHTHELWDSYALGKIDKATLLKNRFSKLFSSFPAIEHDYIDSLNSAFIKLAVKNDEYIDGAKELLEYLKSKYKVVMLSNGFSELQYDKLDCVGFTQYFDEVILSDAVGVNKPHPDIFNYALEKSKATAAETIMIGDNLLADIGGAMRSNIDQIWYNPENKETEIKPTHIVSHLREIMSIL